MAQISLAIYSERPGFVEDVSSHVATSDLATVAHVFDSLEDLAEHAKAFPSDALLLDTSGEPEAVLAEIANLAEPRPALLIAADASDGPLILRAMRLGVREVIALEPLSNEIDEAIERIARECAHHAPEPATNDRPAKVVALMGAKGGVGATSLACQLAFELARTGERTALIDLNLPIGDVALHCDLQTPYSVANLVSDRGADPTYVASLFGKHPTGVAVLGAPRRIEEAERVQGDHIQHAIAALRDRYDWIILDVSRSWSEPSIRALDLADQVIVVVELDVPTLGHARNHLDVLERLGHTGDKVRVIANRFTKDDPLTPKDCEGFIGRAPDLLLPNDFRSMAAAVNEGRPVSEIAKKSPLRHALVDLAGRLHDWCGVAATSEAENASGLTTSLKRLFGKGK